MRISFSTVQTPSGSKFVYRDLDLSLKKASPVNYQLEKSNETNDIAAIVDMQCIMASLHNLFSTKPGEKALNPAYGSNLQKYLFEPMTPAIFASVADEIQSAISRFEPRVSIIDLQVDGNYEQSTLYITLLFSVDGLSGRKTANLTITDGGVAISN